MNNSTMVKSWHYWLYGILAILGLALGAFNQQLGAGAVPLPAAWLWIAPILSAAIVALAVLLPKVGQTVSDQIYTWHYWAYGGLIVLSAALDAFNQQLGAHHVPIFAGWEWTAPILSAVIVGLTMLLPKMGSLSTGGAGNSMLSKG